MKITDLLKKDTIILDLQSTSKVDVIEELVGKLEAAGRLESRENYKEAILKRESQSTTGIGEGIAIPHAKTSAVKTPAIAFGRAVNGIDYESLDGQPARLFFMIAASDGANNTHLETLSRLSMLLMDADFRQVLLKADSIDFVLKAIDAKEREGEEEDEVVEDSNENLILAVTACPTGIAHTYMAADSLKAKAKEMNVNLKVETNGSSGIKGKLTAEEIESAVAIIVAADKQVEIDRFKGKHVIQVPVAHGIRRPQELIEQALKQDAPVYKVGGGSASREEVKTDSTERRGFYKHLMNGVSNMLPFVVAGGILIAISFIFGVHASDPNSPSYNPIAATLKTIGSKYVFSLMIPVLAGFIAMSIADRPGFVAGMVGGLMASLGGAGFLGGLIAGFLGGYIVVGLKKAFDRLPQSLDGIKPVLLYPLFGVLLTSLIMMYIIINPVKAVNDGLTTWLLGLGTTNLLFLGLILGGMMAVDMGGPINKAALTFGIAMIDAGNYAPHAAIMAGGMVSPLGLALATTFFRNKFTEQERETGKTSYFMGLSFITEGAIPFAAADPARVIPACVIGSAIAGALSMLFKIGLPAPHGGVFVIPIVIGNPFLYALAILIGSIVTALIVGFLKPIKIENNIEGERAA
ncbi:fructose-specific PTS transporter subunit EIIC [Bacillus sp. ISL-7]|uniref:PTS fructose transporter subunit IIABC n=1 Tax=Bacillus sp. ISL-7 TaxID=2819136 RepID=UPI001BED0E64|nr:fructose-specific PTS transporter subunit EIIC [Bacillus sp. ISL-7]MBT2734058.1 PTS sugar transporter subunit IIA [Bacillus sp. ISL-7]